MDKSLYQKLKSDKEKHLDNLYKQLYRYNMHYEEIYTPRLSRVISNFSSNTLYWITDILSFTLFLGFLFMIIDHGFQPKLKEFVQTFMAGETFAFFPHAIIILLTCMLLLWVSFLIRKVYWRNQVIQQLSELLEEVIDSEEKNIELEKSAYFNLLDIIEQDRNRPEGYA